MSRNRTWGDRKDPLPRKSPGVSSASASSTGFPANTASDEEEHAMGSGRDTPEKRVGISVPSGKWIRAPHKQPTGPIVKPVLGAGRQVSLPSRPLHLSGRSFSCIAIGLSVADGAAKEKAMKSRRRSEGDIYAELEKPVSRYIVRLF